MFSIGKSGGKINDIAQSALAAVGYMVIHRVMKIQYRGLSPVKIISLHAVFPAHDIGKLGDGNAFGIFTSSVNCAQQVVQRSDLPDGCPGSVVVRTADKISVSVFYGLSVNQQRGAE